MLLNFRKLTNPQRISLLFGGLTFATAIGTIGVNAYQQGAAQREFVRQNEKALYDKGAETLKTLHQAYGDLLNSLVKPDFAIPTEVYDRDYERITIATQKLGEFNEDLARLSDKRKVEAGQEIYAWAHHLLIKSSLHRQKIEALERATFNLVSFPKREGPYYLRLQKDLFNKMDELVQSENQLYFSLSAFDLEALDAIEQGLYITFKEDLRLEPVPNMYERYTNRKVLIAKAHSYKFEALEGSFILARVRPFTAPEVRYHDTSDLSREQTANLKGQVLTKYILATLNKHPELKGTLPPDLRADLTQPNAPISSHDGKGGQLTP